MFLANFLKNLKFCFHDLFSEYTKAVSRQDKLSNLSQYMSLQGTGTNWPYERIIDKEENKVIAKQTIRPSDKTYDIQTDRQNNRTKFCNIT